MFIPDFTLLGDFADAGKDNAFRGSFNDRHAITRTLDKQLVLPVIRTVSLIDEMPEGVSGEVLIRSTPDTWAESDLRAVVDGISINMDPGESLGPNPVMVAVAARSRRAVAAGERMRDARVVVLGDADISTNEAINHVSNQDLLLNSIAWLSENEELIAIRPTADEDQPLILSRDQQGIIAWIATLGPRIVRVHVKDYKFDPGGRDGFCALGDGDVNWSGVMTALHAAGYNGPLTYEGKGDLADIARRLDKIAN